MDDYADIYTEQNFGDAPIFLFSDHASKAIPANYHGLGLPSDLLETHIAWDIGSSALTDKLGSALQGQTLKCGFSRLLIDANRACDKEDLIPPTSDKIAIPGNQNLTAEERENRIQSFHAPYHAKLGAMLAAFEERHKDPLIVSIHSFTDRLMGTGEERPWPIGLLWRADAVSAIHTINALATNTGWQVGDNEPYDARIFNYTIDRHIGDRGVRHLTFEVRQDMIADDEGVTQMCSVLQRVLSTLLR